MRRLLPLLLSAVFLSAFLPGVNAQGQRQWAGIGLAVYEHADFQGLNATFIEDMPDLSQTGLDRQISSLRVAQGEVWQVCTEPNYRGRCQLFSGQETNLDNNGWNDVIASARRIQGGGNRGGGIGRGGGGGRGAAAVDRGTIELFAGTNYSGQRQIVTEAETNLLRVNFNDRAISLRVAPGDTWEICVNVNYDNCRIVDTDIQDLASIGLSRQISSIRPRQTGGVGRGGRGSQAARGTIELFAGINYSGQQQIITRAESNLQRVNFNDRAMSVRVAPGDAWEICVNANYDGCAVVDSNMAELASIGLNREISSLRPHVAGSGASPVGRGAGRGGASPRAQIILYDMTNYQGRSIVLTENTPNIQQSVSSAASIRIVSGRWEVCPQPKYGGRCVTLSQDVPDVRELSLPGRIVSARTR